jgi:hypothetical protein
MDEIENSNRDNTENRMEVAGVGEISCQNITRGSSVPRPQPSGSRQNDAASCPTPDSEKHQHSSIAHCVVWVRQVEGKKRL